MMRSPVRSVNKAPSPTQVGSRKIDYENNNITDVSRPTPHPEGVSAATVSTETATVVTTMPREAERSPPRGGPGTGPTGASAPADLPSTSRLSGDKLAPTIRKAEGELSDLELSGPASFKRRRYNSMDSAESNTEMEAVGVS